jgi:hypothetical protein
MAARQSIRYSDVSKIECFSSSGNLREDKDGGCVDVKATILTARYPLSVRIVPGRNRFIQAATTVRRSESR